jgi:hypothetical protein
VQATLDFAISYVPLTANGAKSLVTNSIHHGRMRGGRPRGDMVEKRNRDLLEEEANDPTGELERKRMEKKTTFFVTRTPASGAGQHETVPMDVLAPVASVLAETPALPAPNLPAFNDRINGERYTEPSQSRVGVWNTKGKVLLCCCSGSDCLGGLKMGGKKGCVRYRGGKERKRKQQKLRTRKRSSRRGKRQECSFVRRA